MWGKSTGAHQDHTSSSKRAPVARPVSPQNFSWFPHKIYAVLKTTRVTYMFASTWMIYIISNLTSPESWGLHWSSSSTQHPHNPNTWGRNNVSTQLSEESQRVKSVNRIHSPLITQSNHTLISRSGHNGLFWLHVNHGLALWHSRRHQTHTVEDYHIRNSLTLATNEQKMFYLLYHLFLDGFFDILDFLSFVTIDQHDLTQECTLE